MNRKQQQAELLFKLGQLVGPLLKITEHPGSYDTEERTRILARYFAEQPGFDGAFKRFTLGEPGHHYLPQNYRLNGALGAFAHVASQQVTEKQLFDSIRALYHGLFEAVQSIPVPVESAIHEAQTPFSTYCLLKDVCSTTKTAVVWVDRYFDHKLFHRFLADVPRSVPITLVTWPATSCKGKVDERRYVEFIDVSRLFAQEKGPAGYRLVTNEDIHTRYLRCDDKLFTPGDSIKELGKDVTFTVGKLDPTEGNLRQVDELVSRGTEVFGPSQTTHP